MGAEGPESGFTIAPEAAVLGPRNAGRRGKRLKEHEQRQRNLFQDGVTGGAIGGEYARDYFVSNDGNGLAGTDLHDASFDDGNGAEPDGALHGTTGGRGAADAADHERIELMKGKRMNGVARGWRVVWVVSGLAGMAAGQTLTTLHSFDGRNGADPGVALVQELNGDLYGTTTYGGSAQSGTIFRVTQQGGFQKVYDFPSGTYDSALTVVSNGTLYGTTVVVAGPTVSGTLFKMLPGGTPQTIHNFDSTEGQPGGGVVQGFNGMFYGFASMPFPAKGIIYESMPDGTVTILHAFSGSDGWAPVQGLTQGTERTGRARYST